MTRVWNVKDLQPPPVCLLRCKNDFDNTALYEKTRDALSTCADILKKKDALTTDMHILSRLLYKLRNQLRSDKALRILKQIHVCLKNYMDVDLHKIVDEMSSIFNEVDYTETTFLLPSQQMIWYTLNRLLGVSILLQKTADYCGSAFELLQKQLSHGTLIPQNLVLISLVSRVWAITKSLSSHIQSCYNIVYPVQERLGATCVK